MDTRTSQSSEEELEHLKEVSQPEDFKHPEPDASQPEALEPAHGLHWVLPIVVVLVLVAGVAFVLLKA
ncbi:MULTISPECIES: hypothetical protein [Halomonadaceae]|uniref:Uncharacterized protein n=1 Tax=Onishia taeanensis TaxID=284577 RepID=A0A328XMG5_9GAMM|nr:MULTISPECIES: hypothetical protein [Halomonas]RAR60972.1 hypothetical protein BCL93_106178 [Halomonas taeanensis]